MGVRELSLIIREVMESWKAKEVLTVLRMEGKGTPLSWPASSHFFFWAYKLDIKVKAQIQHISEPVLSVSLFYLGADPDLGILNPGSRMENRIRNRCKG